MTQSVTPSNSSTGKSGVQSGAHSSITPRSITPKLVEDKKKEEKEETIHGKSKSAQISKKTTTSKSGTIDKTSRIREIGSDLQSAESISTSGKKSKKKRTNKLIYVQDKVTRTQILGRRKSSDAALEHVKPPWSIASIVNKVIDCLRISSACACAFLVFLIVPVSCIIVGVVYLEKCPAEKNVPVFLLVFGICTAVWLVGSLRVLSNYRKRNPDSKIYDVIVVFDGLVVVFLVFWTIAGSVWTFPMNIPEFDDNNSTVHCERTVFYFTYTLLCCIYALLSLGVIVCLCMCVWACCRKH